MVKTIEHRHCQRVDSSIGTVRLLDIAHAVVPAGQAVVFEGLVSVQDQVTETWTVMKPPSCSPFPGGLLAVRCLLTLPQLPLQKDPTVLKKESMTLLYQEKV